MRCAAQSCAPLPPTTMTLPSGATVSLSTEAGRSSLAGPPPMGTAQSLVPTASPVVTSRRVTIQSPITACSPKPVSFGWRVGSGVVTGVAVGLSRGTVSTEW